MDEKTISTPVEQNDNIAPNIDAELDAALNKSFASMRGESAPDNKPEAPKESREKNFEKKEPSSSNTEVKPELKQESKKVEKSIDEKPSLSQEEIEKIDPKEKGAWGAIKNANRSAHATIQARDAEIQKLKSTLAEKGSSAQKELDEIKSKMSELEKYRAMVDIQADPEFISKYDEPIKNHIQSIKGMIKALGVTDEAIETGIDFNSNESLDRVINLISQHKDRFSAAKIENKIKDYLALSDKRNETLEEQKKNFKETLEKRKQESFAKQSEGEGRMIKHIELKASQIPFLNKIQPKEGATQTEIDQANNHNGLVEVMGKKLQEVIKMKEPEQQAEIAIAAIASHYLNAQLKAVNEELKKAKEELQKMSVVTSETPTRKPNNPSGRNGNSEPLDHDSALSSYFSKRR